MINLEIVAPAGSRFQPVVFDLEDSQSASIPLVGDSVYIDRHVCKITGGSLRTTMTGPHRFRDERVIDASTAAAMHYSFRRSPVFMVVVCLSVLIEICPYTLS